MRIFLGDAFSILRTVPKKNKDNKIMNNSLTGAMTAIVTPFAGGNIDETALRSLVDWQINEGIQALVPCGTTGESATLSTEERARVVRIVVDEARGRVPVIAGAGSNNTAQAIEYARMVKDAGAAAHLQVTPYYNKPTQEGLYLHFKAIAEAVDLPMILYNVPGRTAVNMEPATTLRLAALPRIIGIKEACGKLDQVQAIAAQAPEGFVVLSGEDAQNLEIYKLGGKGCISVAGNVAPRQVAGVWKRFAADEVPAAERAQNELQKLNTAMFFETNPIPAKTALAMMGRVREEFRLPMTRMSEANRTRLETVLKQYALI